MTPRVFISYSWDDDAHKLWVRELATRLRQDGIDVSLDQWDAVPGDQLAEFIEKSIRENDFVIIVCTPNYKRKSDDRTGGVGYEGDIIAGELLNVRSHRKFIPVLRASDWEEAAPGWLLGKIYIPMYAEPITDFSYEALYNAVTKPLSPKPVLGQQRRTESRAAKAESAWNAISESIDEEDYHSFLNNFRETIHAGVARRHLAQLEIWQTVKSLEPKLVEKVLHEQPFPALGREMLRHLSAVRANVELYESLSREHTKLSRLLERVKWVPDEEVALRVVFFTAFPLALIAALVNAYYNGRSPDSLFMTVLVLTAGLFAVVFMTLMATGFPIMVIWFLFSLFGPYKRSQRRKTKERIHEIEKSCPWIVFDGDCEIRELVRSQDFVYHQLVQRVVNQRNEEFRR